jgi:glycosyltransferase involved in cell wall biosynthesis
MRRASVIVRARDKAASIGQCLSLITGQRAEELEVELILVDGGSRDRTMEIAADHGALVLSTPVTEFSLWWALNLGAAAAPQSSHGPW